MHESNVTICGCLVALAMWWSYFNYLVELLQLYGEVTLAMWWSYFNYLAELLQLFGGVTLAILVESQGICGGLTLATMFDIVHHKND